MTRRRTLACTLLAALAVLGVAPALASGPVASSSSFVCVFGGEDRHGSNAEGVCVWLPR